MKEHVFQGNFKFEDLAVGQKFLNVYLGTESDVVEITSNTVNMFNRCDRTNLDDAGHRKGIDCTQWYTIQDFNKQFKPLV